MLMAVENRGPVMHSRIGVLRALNRSPAGPTGAPNADAERHRTPDLQRLAERDGHRTAGGVSGLALLHLCGPEWGSNPPPEINVDTFTIWNSTGPELRSTHLRPRPPVPKRPLPTPRPGRHFQRAPEPVLRTR